jgi:hypothetical protein
MSNPNSNRRNNRGQAKKDEVLAKRRMTKGANRSKFNRMDGPDRLALYGIYEMIFDKVSEE